MFCTKCGSIVAEGSKFCTSCGARLDESFFGEKEETAAGKGASSIFSADFSVDDIRCKSEEGEAEHVSEITLEPVNEEKSSACYENNYNTYTGTADTSGTERMNQESAYTLADMPEKMQTKEPKKRSCLVSVICGFFTLVCGLIMFASILSLLLVSVFNKQTSKVLSVGTNSGNLGDVPVSAIMDEDDEDYDEDITFAQYVYNNLNEKTKNEVELEDVEKILNDPAINEFFGDVISDYTQVAVGAKEEASISVDSVMELVKESEDIIEDAIGRDMKESDYEKIEKELKKMDIEEKTKVEKPDSLNSDEEEVVEMIAYFFGNTGAIMLSLLGTALVMAVLILLFNLHKPYRPLFHLGYNIVVSAIIGLGVGAAYDMLLDEMDQESVVILNMISGFIGNPQKNITANSIAFLVIGAIILVLWIVAKVIASKRVAEYNYE